MTEKKETSQKKKLMKWAKRIFLILVAVFLVRYFYNNIDDYKNPRQAKASRGFCVSD